jgi:uncharacterized protein YraI
MKNRGYYNLGILTGGCLQNMLRRSLVFTAVSMIGLALLALGPAAQEVRAQQPTVAIATVTGTAIGPFLVVNLENEQVNVRSGPGTDYPAVGVLVSLEQVPVRGRSAGGDWVQIAYPGVAEGVAWVYAPYVTLFQAANLAIIEQPPTPTPRITPTIDPTLAAQFVLEAPPTRMPTFTAPSPLQIPELEESDFSRAAGVPVGMWITAIGLLGLFGSVVSYLRER